MHVKVINKYLALYAACAKLFPGWFAIKMATENRHSKAIDEGILRILSRAGNTRSLSAESLRERITNTLQKYLFKYSTEASDQDILSFLDSLHADELCLVAACEQGDETAWAELLRVYGPVVQSVARSLAKSEDGAQEIADSVWAELYGLRKNAGSMAGKLAYYSGQGSLGGWLRAVVSQMAVDGFRRGSRLVQLDGDEMNNGHMIQRANENPESELAVKEISTEVESALSQVLMELVAEDRLLLKLYYVDGITLREAGLVLGFHEATASRRLSRTLKEMKQRLEEHFLRKNGWSRNEVGRFMSEAVGQLESNPERVFGGERVS
jgi:RNA polymerase sigma-70 factor, ECF subfamily